MLVKTLGKGLTHCSGEVVLHITVAHCTAPPSVSQKMALAVRTTAVPVAHSGETAYGHVRRPRVPSGQQRSSISRSAVTTPKASSAEEGVTTQPQPQGRGIPLRDLLRQETAAKTGVSGGDTALHRSASPSAVTPSKATASSEPVRKIQGSGIPLADVLMNETMRANSATVRRCRLTSG